MAIEPGCLARDFLWFPSSGLGTQSGKLRLPTININDPSPEIDVENRAVNISILRQPPYPIGQCYSLVLNMQASAFPVPPRRHCGELQSVNILVNSCLFLHRICHGKLPWRPSSGLGTRGKTHGTDRESGRMPLAEAPVRGHYPIDAHQ